jgi:cell division protein FtsB
MTPRRDRRFPPARIITWATIAGGLGFAIFAGEYSTLDLFTQRERKAQLTAQVDSLTRVVDSLRHLKTAIQTDPAVQERIAREEFGMVKGGKELLYRFSEPDTARARDSTRHTP